MATIKTPKPPLNIFNATRTNIENNSNTWITLYEVDNYEIPRTPVSPSRNVDTSAIMTGLLISNLSDDVDIEVSVKIEEVQNTSNSYTIIHKVPIPIHDFASLKLDRQMLKPGERLQARCWTNDTKLSGNTIASTHLSYILNQSEDFTVLP